MSKKPTLDDVYTLDLGHHVMQEETDCPECGDEFEVGNRVLEVPWDSSDRSSRMIITVHLHCAVRNDEIDLTPQPKWHVFDKDDESTWPQEPMPIWVFSKDDEDELPSIVEWAGDSWEPWKEDADFWMPIEVPEPPQ